MRAGINLRRDLPQRTGGIGVPNRLAQGKVLTRLILRHHQVADVVGGNRRLPGRVEHQLFDFGADTAQAQAGRGEQQRQCFGLDGEFVLVETLLDPGDGIAVRGERPAIHAVGLFSQQLHQAAIAVQPAGDEYERRHGLGLLAVGLEFLGWCGAALALLDQIQRALRIVSVLAAALGRQQGLGLVDNDDPPRRHHRQGASRGENGADQRVAAGRVAGLIRVETLDVEGMQALVHDPGKLEREVVPRLQVVALEQVERRRLTRLDQLAHVDGGQVHLRYFSDPGSRVPDPVRRLPEWR